MAQLMKFVDKKLIINFISVQNTNITKKHSEVQRKLVRPFLVYHQNDEDNDSDDDKNTDNNSNSDADRLSQT